MADPTNEELLEQWCKWLFPQSNPDAASDPDGNIVMTKNKGRDIWFIPGSWNRVDSPVRKISVPSGTKLFIVAASSHATPPELPNGRPGGNQELKDLASDLDSKWMQFVCKIGPKDHETVQKLDRAMTDVFQVEINASNGYASQTNVSGNVNMVTVGQVCLFEPAQGKTSILIGAQAPQTDLVKKGSRYNVQVSYEVTVQ